MFPWTEMEGVHLVCREDSICSDPSSEEEELQTERPLGTWRGWRDNVQKASAKMSRTFKASRARRSSPTLRA